MLCFCAQVYNNNVYLRGQFGARFILPPLSEVNTITVLFIIPARINALVTLATESSRAECIPESFN